jgi:hypothetical protein
MVTVIFQEIGFSAIHIFFNDNPKGKDEIYFNHMKKKNKSHVCSGQCPAVLYIKV